MCAVHLHCALGPPVWIVVVMTDHIKSPGFGKVACNMTECLKQEHIDMNRLE